MAGTADNRNGGRIDPIVGGRLRYVLKERWSFEIDADVGGFGAGSDITWRARVTAAWHPTRWFDVQLGWIWLDTFYQNQNFAGPSRFKWDVLMQGPYLGVGFTL